MSLDDCIAALPRIEKGVSRDIFSPIPSHPEPYSIDLVREYARFICSAADQERSHQPQSQQQQQPKHHNEPPKTGPRTGLGSSGQGAKDTGTEGFNCTVCKKSFNSQATWNNHQMSAKHVAAVKEAEKKSKGGSKSNSSKRGNNSSSNSTGGRNTQQRKNADTSGVEEEDTPDPPEVTEALMSFRKVTKVVKENPSMAASVMWKIAKVLWSFRQSRETAKVLSLLIHTLCDLQAGTVPEGGGGGGGGGGGSLTPTQISMTLYLSRLSMARLLVYQSPGKAQEYYLDAILGRWQIDFTAFQSMCEMVNTNSAAQLLDHCKQFLTTHPKTEKLMNPITTPASAAGQTATTTTPSTSATAVAKKPADPNLKLLAILLESAHMLPAGVTTTTSITKEDQLRGETSLALFAMAAALTEAEAGVPEATRDSNSSNDNHRVSHVVNILRSMSRVYRQLVMPFSAAACLIRAGELGLQQQQDRQDLCKDLPPLPPKDDSAMMLLWDLFQALLLAMETGDFVRMQSAIHLLNRCNPASAFYQDVQTIIQVAGAVISQDNDYLHNNASYALEHLSLLIQEGNDEAKAQLLLCQPRQNNLVSPATGMDTIRKVQQLLA